MSGSSDRENCKFYGEAGALLSASGVADFEALWTLQGESVDTPNRRGEGWSAVSRHRVSGDKGGERVFYLKRQQDYFPRRALISGKLLLCREHRRIRLFAERGVASLDVAAVGIDTVDGRVRGVLATVALVDHVPLDALLAQYGNKLPDVVIAEVADFLRRMHDRRLYHGNLYPKHLYVHRDLIVGGKTRDAVRVIDLEDARSVPFRHPAVVRDLEKLNRYAEGLSMFRRLRFLLRYRGERRFSRAGRRLLDAIVARGQGRGKGRARKTIG